METLEGRRVLVTGATGFVASQLIPALEAEGAQVRATSRHPDEISARMPGVEAVASDLLDPASLGRALDGVEIAYYLVHSMGGNNFEEDDRRAATNFRVAAESAGIGRIIYLSGLGRPDKDLSRHLKSRHEVGALLASGPVPVTELRCAIVIGSGSVAFDMLRYLTERLPGMIAPRWLSTKIQPLAQADLSRYLVAAAKEEEPGGVVEIGGRDVVTYREMILGYAQHRRLRRVIVGVPVLSPRLSSYWVNLITPVSASIARPLIDGLRNEVIVTEPGAESRFPDVEPVGYRDAVAQALDAQVSALGSSAMTGRPPAPGTDTGIISDARRLDVDAPADRAGKVLHTLGGDRSWYPLRWAWWARARLDDLFGGVGLAWRRPEAGLTKGAKVDWWTVEEAAENALLLRADMKTPGEAWLSLRVDPTGDKTSELSQAAYFRPRGLLGRLYWWALLPFHVPIFRLMGTRLATRMASR